MKVSGVSKRNQQELPNRYFKGKPLTTLFTMLMRQMIGLENISEMLLQPLNTKKLAELCLKNFQKSVCEIYGSIGNDDKILLAKLELITETLVYDQFDDRLDLCVGGPILRADCPPLTYKIQGDTFGFKGRCSMVAKVCGVDLYLHRSYTGLVGDIARQRFSLSIRKIASSRRGRP